MSPCIEKRVVNGTAVYLRIIPRVRVEYSAKLAIVISTSTSVIP